MMPFLEVQRAHDILHGQVTGEAPRVIEADGRLPAKGALDALCWILGHTHNGAFARNLAAIEKELAEQGYVLTRAAVEAIDQPVTAEGLAKILDDLLHQVGFNSSGLVKFPWDRLDPELQRFYVARCRRFLELFDVTQKGPSP